MTISFAELFVFFKKDKGYFIQITMVLKRVYKHLGHRRHSAIRKGKGHPWVVYKERLWYMYTQDFFLYNLARQSISL